MIDVTGAALSMALRHGHRIPEPLVRGVADAAALAVGHAPGGPARSLPQLRANLARVRPDLASPGREAELDALTRENLRRYLRYYAQMLTLGRLTATELAARVRIDGLEHLTGPIASGTTVVGALGHLGDWDLAGAWLSARGVRTVSVAEHLEPEDVFRGFLRAREDLGMTIVPLEKGSTFRPLLRAARSAPSFVPLLADRDLTAQGLRVDLLGHPARVAAGPAALARALRAPLVVVALHHERLYGERARAAGFLSGAGWGLAGTVRPVDTAGDVPTVTQRWVTALGEAIRARPADWHMLQPVWEADLDPARTTRPAGRSA